MDGWFNNVSRQEEEDELMVSAFYHVISGGDEDHQQTPPPAQTEHRPIPVAQAPPVFNPGECSSSNVNNKKKKKKVGKEYRGVRQRGNKWISEIWDPHQGKVQWLGSFAAAEEAARAYDRKAIELRGASEAFQYLNFPLEDYGYLAHHLGTTDNAVRTAVGPGLSSSASAGTSKSAPSHSGTELLPTNNINYNAAAEQDIDPFLLVDDNTLQEYLDLANSLLS